MDGAFFSSARDRAENDPVDCGGTTYPALEMQGPASFLCTQSTESMVLFFWKTSLTSTERK
jgi:hypothetical protein